MLFTFILCVESATSRELRGLGGLTRFRESPATAWSFQAWRPLLTFPHGNGEAKSAARRRSFGSSCPQATNLKNWVATEAVRSPRKDPARL